MCHSGWAKYDNKILTFSWTFGLFGQCINIVNLMWDQIAKLTFCYFCASPQSILHRIHGANLNLSTDTISCLENLQKVWLRLASSALVPLYLDIYKRNPTFSHLRTRKPSNKSCKSFLLKFIKRALNFLAKEFNIQTT